MIAIGGTQTACTEFVHWGHISDRENSWGINGVEIAQKQPSGKWEIIGGSDGKGRWEVFKNRIKGGGTIRVSKPGYYTIEMSEAEFLQKHVILMQSTGGEDSDESLPSEWLD
ncbi:MAG: hypothetical protein H6819_07860 [Phycisphaerales bacterium]|nr:hypothetical protein [Phycisphaerales bacterium]MCB9854310.1 hypothetical protein [Phycisphaerales bacterium]MCB9863511.1 hypothetical protein [Phycisphaerales bacterium]